LNSSSCTLASQQNLPTAASCPCLVPIPFGACLLAANQLPGAAGPGGGLSPARNLRREPGFGGGASTSASCNRRRSCGGTVRWDTTSVTSFMRCEVARGVCSRRSWEMRSLTDCGGAGFAVAARVAGVAWGFIERKAGWCFLGMLSGRARGCCEGDGRGTVCIWWACGICACGESKALTGKWEACEMTQDDYTRICELCGTLRGVVE
jgi:hypothetical protein